MTDIEKLFGLGIGGVITYKALDILGSQLPKPKRKKKKKQDRRKHLAIL